MLSSQDQYINHTQGETFKSRDPLLTSHPSGFKSPKLLDGNVATYKIKSARHTNFDFKHSSDSGSHLPSSNKLFKNSSK